MCSKKFFTLASSGNIKVKVNKLKKRPDTELSPALAKSYFDM